MASLRGHLLLDIILNQLVTLVLALAGASSTVSSCHLLLKKMPKKQVNLSVSRGEKLPVSQGAGLTAKGRAKYNAATGSNLKAPAPHPKTEKDESRRKSFCARKGGMSGPMKDEKGRPTRKALSLRKWDC
jgi:hypothetical protein